MKTIEIEPTETDIEKLMSGTMIDLSAADIQALRNLRELTRGKANDWFSSHQFLTDNYTQVYVLWPYLQHARTFKWEPWQYRLNDFGYFILDLADGIATVKLEVDEDAKNE